MATISAWAGVLIAAVVTGLAGCGAAGPAGAGSAAAPASPGAAVSSPAPGPQSISETGSTLLYPLFNEWAQGYKSQFPNVTITTAGTGSSTGIADAADRKSVV